MTTPSIPNPRYAGQTSDRFVDHSALRINQAFIISLLVLAFVLDTPLIVVFVAAVMLVGTAAPRLALFKLIYANLLRPAGLVRPDTRADNPEPHQFAQGVGGVVLAVAAVAFALGWSGLGWALAWMVVALAALNLFAGMCVGCLMYYQLHRLGVPGFTRAPVQRGKG